MSSMDYRFDQLQLAEDEKTEVEKELICLLEKNDDCLIGETLAYLKSTDSLPALKLKLISSKIPESKILWASYINKINQGDIEMKNIAFEEFQKISNNYSLIGLFHILSNFNDKRINERITRYQKDEDYLVTYNAFTALGQDTKKLVANERAKNINKKS
jgi:hypothetical protein